MNTRLIAPDGPAPADTHVPVTFIVTGYNQAHLIEEAIAGAFAQDYPNLQIILTDDHSSDNTFELMRRAAAAYRGPHKVIANRLDVNQGTYGNIYDAFLEATGEIIVLAGGDDVSYPHRTSTIVSHWQRSAADALWSRYDLIDEDGKIILRNHKQESTGLFLVDYFPGRSMEALVGACTACHRSVLTRFPAPPVRIRSEDTYLTLMLGLHGGRIDFIDEALIAYRQHRGALTNETAPAADREAIEARERAQMAFATSQASLLNIFAEQLAVSGADPAVGKLVEDDLRLFRFKSRFDTASWRERLAMIPLAKRRREIHWLMPRIAGMGPFVAMKQLALRRRERLAGRSGAGQR